MKNLLLIATALFLSFAQPALAAPACVAEGSTVTLNGVLMNKAIKMNPDDFGWVPRDGFVQYAVLVVPEAFCLSSEGEEFRGEFVLQIGMSEVFSPAELHRGVGVTVEGKVWREETAHHFQRVILVADKVSRR